jgi:hypothetical protein
VEIARLALDASELVPEPAFKNERQAAPPTVRGLTTGTGPERPKAIDLRVMFRVAQRDDRDVPSGPIRSQTPRGLIPSGAGETAFQARVGQEYVTRSVTNLTRDDYKVLRIYGGE